MTGADVVLRAEGVALGYRGASVLSGIDWTVRAGEAWFLLGPNGSGKSTLLRGVLGLLTPLAGTLYRHPELGALEHTGFVPQRSHTNPTLPTTIRELVSLGTVGIPRARRDPEALVWALERVGLGGMAGRDLRELSGGQRQRALVARALVRRPRLLVLDEPTEGLDVSTEEAFLETLDTLCREESMTLLFVTHALRTAGRRASHVALFVGGGVRTGAREEILRPEVLENAFGVPVERLDALTL